MTDKENASNWPPGSLKKVPTHSQPFTSNNPDIILTDDIDILPPSTTPNDLLSITKAMSARGLPVDGPVKVLVRHTVVDVIHVIDRAPPPPYHGHDWAPAPDYVESFGYPIAVNFQRCASWTPAGCVPYSSQDACSSQTFRERYTAAMINEMLKSQKRHLPHLTSGAFIVEMLIVQETVAQETVEEWHEWMISVAREFYAARPDLFKLLCTNEQEHAGDVHAEDQVSLNGVDTRVVYSLRNMLTIICSYALTHCPAGYVECMASGPHVEEHVKFCAEVAAATKNRSTLKPGPVSTTPIPYSNPFENVPDECLDKDCENVPDGDVHFELKETLDPVPDTTKRLELLWSLEVLMETRTNEIHSEEATVGGLLPFTCLADEISTLPQYQLAEPLRTSLDLHVSDQDFTKLDFNDLPTNIHWRAPDVREILEYVVPTDHTYDMTAMTCKLWSWINFLHQVEAIKRAYPSWTLRFDAPDCFPNIIVLRTRWRWDPKIMDMLNRYLLENYYDPLLVNFIYSAVESWDAVNPVVIMEADWPPAKIDLAHCSGTSHLDKMVNDIQPRAAFITCPQAVPGSITIFFSDFLYDESEDADLEPEYLIDGAMPWRQLKADRYLSRSGWATTTPQRARNSSIWHCCQEGFPSALVYGYDTFVMVHFGKDYYRKRDGRNVLTTTTMLTTDDVIIPRSGHNRTWGAPFWIKSQTHTVPEPLYSVFYSSNETVLHAMLGRANTMNCAAQLFCYQTEWTPLFQETVRGSYFPRPEHKVQSGLERKLSSIIAENPMFFETRTDDPTMSQYLVSISYNMNALNGTDLKPHIGDRTRFFSCPRTGAGRRTIHELMNKLIVDPLAVVELVEAYEIYSIAAKLPLMWPSVMGSVSMEVGLVTDEGFYGEVSPTVTFYTGLNGERCNFVLRRSDRTLAALRYFATALSQTEFTQITCRKTSETTVIGTASRNIVLEYCKPLRPDLPPLIHVDHLRTSQITDNDFFEYSATVNSITLAYMMLQQARYTIRTFMCLPRLGRDWFGKRPAVFMSNRETLDNIRRLRLARDAAARKLSAINMELERIGALVDPSEAK